MSTATSRSQRCLSPKTLLIPLAGQRSTRMSISTRRGHGGITSPCPRQVGTSLRRPQRSPQGSASFSESSDCAKSHTGGFWYAPHPLVLGGVSGHEEIVKMDTLKIVVQGGGHAHAYHVPLLSRLHLGHAILRSRLTVFMHFITHRVSSPRTSCHTPQSCQACCSTPRGRAARASTLFCVAAHGRGAGLPWRTSSRCRDSVAQGAAPTSTSRGSPSTPSPPPRATSDG